MVAQKLCFYGNPVLRKKSGPVDEITDEFKEFIGEMFVTLKQSRGLGLSAPQVGVNKRFFILDLSAASLEFDKFVAINPRVISTSGSQTGEEGCLSFPNLFLEITRPDKVVCEFTDLEGQTRVVEAQGLLARAILHESDHLDGKLFIDHVSPADRDMISGKLKKIKAMV